MDLWVVAAAAGAGYIAKNLPNFSAEKKESVAGSSLRYAYNLQPESRNFLQQLRDKTCPLRRLAQKTVEDDALLDLDSNSDVKLDRPISRDREASIFAEKTGILEGAYNKGFAAGESQRYDDGENKNSSSIRNRIRRLHPTRQLRTAGSYVDNMEHTSCLHPSMPTVRPVLVTNATWEETKPDNESSSPSLRQFESSEEFKEPGKSSISVQKSSSGDGVAFGRSSRSQGAETMLLFISGMTVGILTASASWKNEVDKLSMQLNQMQNLVQDLHEELDMKEMLMVKELDDEGDPPPREDDTPPSIIPSLPDLNESNGMKTNDKTAENLELLSRIEEELQAELEMLEQSFKTSDQDKISRAVELEPEIVRGDLQATKVKDDTSESRSRTTDTASDCSKPANYAVSPWELSLRLHELIEFRLETRIKELELALSHSENRVGVQHSIISGRRFSYSGTESSSTHHSPTCICDERDKREYTGNSFSNDGEPGSKEVDQGTRSINITQNDHHGVISTPNLVQDMPNEDSTSEDEGSDESELLLIKQILERRKSGSGFNFKFE